MSIKLPHTYLVALTCSTLTEVLLITIVYITDIPGDNQYLPKHEGVKNTWYTRLM